MVPTSDGQVVEVAHPFELGARVLEPLGDAEPLGLLAMARAGQKLGQAPTCAAPRAPRRAAA